MKLKISTCITAVIVILLMSSFAFTSYQAKKISDELWKQLGMIEQQGKTDICSSFFTGYFTYYGAKNIKNIAVGDRKGITTDMMDYVKQYLGTPAFQKEYQQYRDREKAKLYPPAAAKIRDELTKKKITEAESTLKTFQELLKTATDPAVIKSHKEQIDFWNKAIADYKSGNSEQIKYELMIDENRYKTEKEAYDQQLKKWETQYPQSPDQFIKQRLNEFLEATKDIDYNAALADKNNRKVFVNPVYERKGGRWKMGFRAGKEVTETARAFAQQWLKGL